MYASMTESAQAIPGTDFEEAEDPYQVTLHGAEIAPVREFVEVAQGCVHTEFRGIGLTLDMVLAKVLRTLPTPALMEARWKGLAWDVCLWERNRLVAAVIASDVAEVPHRVVRFGSQPGAAAAAPTTPDDDSAIRPIAPA